MTFQPVTQNKMQVISTDAAAGTVLAVGDAITVACGDGKAIEILELQPEGKKRMTAKAFLMGHAVKTGDIFQ